MRRSLVLIALVLCVCCVFLYAQAPIAPKPPFTARDAEIGKQLAAKSLEIRAQITNPAGPAEPFKMIGNLYLTATAYLVPGHSPSPTTYVYTVRDGNRDYRTIQFCCWEYPEDLSRAAYINEASVRHTFEMFRKIMPIDIYLELGRYAWGGVVSQPGNLSFAERIERVKADPKLLVNRNIFTQ